MIGDASLDTNACHHCSIPRRLVPASSVAQSLLPLQLRIRIQRNKLSTTSLDLCDPPGCRCIRRRRRRSVAPIAARSLALVLYSLTPSWLHCSLIPRFLSFRPPRVSLTYQSQVIPGYSRRFICSHPQGTWD